MYQRKLPQDAVALRQLAEERFNQRTPAQNPAFQETGDAGNVRELELQKVELELRLEEAERLIHLLTAAVNCTPEAIFIKDREGKYLFVNDAAVAYAGRACDDILGQDDTRMFDARSAVEVMSGDREIMETGAPQSSDQELTIGGQQHSYWTVKAPLYDQQGKVIGIVGSARNVTKIKEAERLVRESEERFRRLAENLPDGLYLLDPNVPGTPLQIIYANRAAAESDGYRSEELIGQSLVRMLDMPTTAAPAGERIERIQRGETLEFEAEHRHRAGHVVPYEVRAVSIPWHGRSVILGINRNISARRQAEQALRKSHRFQQALIHAAGQGICACCPIDEAPFVRFSIWNDQMVQLTGYTLQEINRLGWYQSVYPDPQLQQRAIERMSRMRAGDDLQTEEWEITRKDGRKRNFLISTSVLADDDTRGLVVATMTDVTEFKQIEAALRENESRLAEAQEIGGLGSFEVDLDTWRGRCSNALCRIFGFENDEPFRDFLGFLQRYRHPDDHARSNASRETLLASGVTDEVEHRYLHPDGRERILHVRHRVVRNQAGTPVKLIGTVQDVTDRRRAEEQLKISEARYRTFVEHVTDAMFLHSDDGTIQDVNQRACDSLGYSREELIGRKPFLFDTELTPINFARMHAQLRDNQIVAIETRHRRKDGATFPVEVRVRPFWVEGKRLRISLAQDITHRKQVEQELRASEQRFRELADAIPQIVWIAAPDGGLVHLNARASQYTGVQVGDLTGWSWDRVIHPDDLAATVRDWTQILQTGEPMPLEFRIKNVHGEYRWHITRQVPSRDGDGRIIRWYGTCTDIEDYKRAEDALRASEERYRTLFHSIPDPMFVFDPQSLRFLAVNDAAITNYGYSRIELLQMKMPDIHLPNELLELPPAAGAWESIFQQRETWQHRNRQGAVIDVEITAHSLHLDQRPVCIVLARDVTDRRRVEAEVRRTTELLRVVTEGTPDAVFVKDRAGKYLLFNPAAARFVGKPASAVVGQDDTAIFGPADAALIMEIDRRVVSEAATITSEETLTAAGMTRTYLATKTPYRDGDGNVVGTIGISRDITERKQAEEAYRKISELHETIIRTAAEGIGLYSPRADGLDLVFSVWNDQMTAITGYTHDEINSQGCFELLFRDESAREFARERIRRLVYCKVVDSEEWQIYRRDGERRTISISSTYLESDERPPMLVAMVQDVTERRRQAEELAARQAELRHVSRLNTVGQMVAALSHEVAQPLAAISNYAASCAALIGGRETPPWEMVKPQIDHITQQSRRAADIIQRLREYCRKTTPERTACDANELLRRSVEMVSLELRGANIALEWELAPRVPAIRADHVQLQQVFVNLILNARDSLLEVAAELRKIILRTRVGPDAIWIDVEDTGVGLSDDVSGQLFEPFVTTKPEGMGIGLSICRSILQEHQGDISYHHLESGGVTFRVWLALPPPSATPTRRDS